MDVTFLLSTVTVLSRYPVASRILTSNLVKEKRFNVKFLDTGLQTFPQASKIYKEKVLPQLIEMGTMRSEFVRWWCGNEVFGRFSLAYSFAGHFDEQLIEKIETEYVLFSAPTIMDLPFVRSMLNHNKKVVLGGSSTLIYEPHQIRDLLRKCGADERKLNENLIIVSGYVDLETDLYGIVKQWKDHVITENNFKTMWDAREDFILDHKKIMNTLFHTTINILLNSGCWWGKCRFCTHKYLPSIRFDHNVSVDELMKYIREISAKYETNEIFFNDSYIVNTPKVEEFMVRLNEEGYRIDLYTGILLLKDPKYIDFINRCNIQKLYIGMENTNNFSLDYINKGYHKKEIFEVADALCKNLNLNTFVVFFNIIDLPVENEYQVQSNWENLIHLRDKFKKYNRDCFYNFASLRNFPKTDMIDGKLLRHAREDQMNSEDLVGVWNVYKQIEECGIDLSGISRDITNPAVRYSPDGKQIKSDLYIVNADIIKELARGHGR